MAVKFRPMTSRDYEENCVSNFIHYNDEGTSIRMISGSTESAIVHPKTAEQRGRNTHVRGHVAFTTGVYSNSARIPVLNNIFAGDNGANLGVLLGMSSDLSYKIADCLLVGVLTAEADGDQYEGWKLVPLTEAQASMNLIDIKLGGEWFKFLIDHYDPAKVLANRLNSDCHALEANPMYITEDAYESLSNDDPFKKSFIQISNKVYSRAGATTTEVLASATKEVKSSNSIIPYLFALNEMPIEEARSMLYGFLVEDLSILPYVMRPKPIVGAKSDPLEHLYSRVMYALQSISMHYQNKLSDIQGYATRYRTLSAAVRSLLYKRDASNNPNMKPLFERLSGKNGQVRSYNLGKRQDYSGRSVITIDPFLDIHVVRLPERSIPYIYKPYILYCANTATSMTGESLVSSNNEHTKNLINKVKQYVRKDVLTPYECRQVCNFCEIAGIIRAPGKRYTGKVTTVPIIIGRQPTLHKGSVAAFEVEATSKSSMELSPLVCPGFNADFDGDTMYQSLPLTPEALEEARTILLHSNNLFWAKDGAPLIAPRQEIIYGLNQCTKDVSPREDKTSYILNKSDNQSDNIDAQAYKAVVFNKCHIYDNVSGLTAGKRAFNYCLRGIKTKLLYKFNHAILQRNIGICKHCGAEAHWMSTADIAKCPVCDSTNSMIIYTTDYVRKCNACEASTTISDEDTTEAKEYIKAYAAKLAESGIMQEAQKLKALFVIEQTLADASVYNGMYNIIKTGLSIDNLNISELVGGTDTVSDTAILFETLMQQLTTLREVEANTPPAVGVEYSLTGIADALIEAIKNSQTSGEMLESCAKIVEVAREDSQQGLFMRAAVYLRATSDRQKATSFYTNTCPTCGCIDGKGYAVTKDTISFYVRELILSGVDNFTRAINDMVKLGFCVAKYYAPTLNVLSDISYSAEFQEFHESIAKQKEYYEAGLMEELEFTKSYTEKFKAFKNKIYKGAKATQNSMEIKKLADKLGDANGFLKMVQSGARGSMDNLAQMYAYKGQIRKDAYSFFNTVIESSLIQQLSPLEHFTAAYGARRGIMDRSLETADIGYMSRQMWHATQSYVITEDCGTKNGLPFNKEMFADYTFSSRNEGEQFGEMQSILGKMLVGRYLANNSERAITKKRALEIAHDIVNNGKTYIVRSPLTCDNPCCTKCYGFDMSTHTEAVVGTPVGIIAAQAVGETTSQLTMRTFQGGGVAGTGAITSAFDTAEALFHMSASSGKESPDYSPVAWATGSVITLPDSKDIIIVDKNTPLYELPKGSMIKGKFTAGESIFTVLQDGQEDIIADEDYNIYVEEAENVLKVYSCGKARRIKEVPAGKRIKSKVKRGEGLFTGVNSYDLNELVQFRGFEGSQLYYVLKLFNLFASYDINLKHFEILVGSMSHYQLINKPTNNSRYSKLKIGCFYSRIELIRMGFFRDPNLIFRETFISILKVPLASTSAVAGIDFEEMSSGLIGDMILQKEENFDDMLEAMTFGMKPKCGSVVNPDFIEQRVNQVISEEYL